MQFSWLAVMSSMDKLSWVLDITVAYPDGKPLDLPTIVMGYRKACRTHFCYRLYPAAQVGAVSNTRAILD